MIASRRTVLAALAAGALTGCDRPGSRAGGSRGRARRARRRGREPRAGHCPAGGTRNAGEVYDEVATNQARLRRLPGVPPRLFRAGTAYCDDVAARIVTAMGDRLVSFSVNGDGGATFTPGQVRSIVTAAPGGSIVICHMNHPDSGTAPGIAASVPDLLARGYCFVRLSDELR
jgi:peptidoglycan/xylan/chitin deacetylase (PgdA/CDA1 family)